MTYSIKYQVQAYLITHSVFWCWFQVLLLRHQAVRQPMVLPPRFENHLAPWKKDFWEKGWVCRANYGPPFNKLLSKLNLLDVCVSQIYFANCGLPKNMNKCLSSFIAWLGLFIIITLLDYSIFHPMQWMASILKIWTQASSSSLSCLGGGSTSLTSSSLHLWGLPAFCQDIILNPGKNNSSYFCLCCCCSVKKISQHILIGERLAISPTILL